MNILRRNPNKDSAKHQNETQKPSMSILRRAGLEQSMVALSRFIAERRLININILEIEGGVVVQGVTDADTEYGQVTFLQTHVLSESELRALIERFGLTAGPKPR